MEKTGSLKSKIFISISLAAMVFIALSFYGEFESIVEAFKTFPWPYIPVILGFATLNFILRFMKWHYYLSLINVNLSKMESVLIFFSGLSMSITPGKFGELLKPYLIKKHNSTPVSHSAPVVLAERFTDFVAVVVLSTFGVFSFQYGVKVFVVGIVIMCLVLVTITQKQLMGKIIRYSGTRLKFLSRVTHKIEAAYESTYKLLLPLPLVIATLLSLAAWFCECYAFYLVLKGLALKSTLFQATFVYAFATLVGAVSMLPGGLGATEGSMTGLLVVLFHENRSGAVAATLIVRLCTLWYAVLLGGLVLLVTQKVLSSTQRPMKTQGF